MDIEHTIRMDMARALCVCASLLNVRRPSLAARMLATVERILRGENLPWMVGYPQPEGRGLDDED